MSFFYFPERPTYQIYSKHFGADQHQHVQQYEVGLADGDRQLALSELVDVVGPGWQKLRNIFIKTLKEYQYEIISIKGIHDNLP